MATGLKNKLSFQKSLFVFLICFFFIFLFGFFAIQNKREKTFKAEKLNYELQIFNTEIGDALAENKNELHNVIYENGNPLLKNVRVTIIDTLGNVIFDTEKPKSEMENHINRPEIIAAKNNGMGYTIRRSSKSVNEDFFYSAKKINKYIIRSALPYSISLGEILGTDSYFILYIVITAIIIFFAAYFFTRSIGVNIKKLKRFAMQADNDEIIDTKKLFPNNELGEISNHIVQIYTRLQKARQDIIKEKEEIQRQESEKNRIKRQLTQNINHELKTPVSSINGYLETILNNPDIPKEQIMIFVNKSYEQCNRLSKLLKDISTITRIEEAKSIIEKEKLNVTEIVNEIMNEIALRPANNKMRIHSNMIEPVIVNGNISLLHSVFSNLVENSILHSGGRDIYINLNEETDEYFYFSFYDNGIGVEPEHLDRIFERFYRVDKGRSRKLGGTGLGLSIVKNAIIFHGGTIFAKTNDNGGLEFVFSIKKQ